MDVFPGARRTDPCAPGTGARFRTIATRDDIRMKNHKKALIGIFCHFTTRRKFTSNRRLAAFARAPITLIDSTVGIGITGRKAVTVSLEHDALAHRNSNPRNTPPALSRIRSGSPSPATRRGNFSQLMLFCGFSCACHQGPQHCRVSGNRVIGNPADGHNGGSTESPRAFGSTFQLIHSP